MEAAEMKRIIEALLLVAEGPLTVAEVLEITKGSSSDIRRAFEEIAKGCDAQAHGFRLKELAGGFQWITDPALSESVKQFVKLKERRRISQASLETLAIIAYKQPLTRSEIEFIRGVNVEGALKTILEKGLIRISGRKEVPGRPMLYSTTKEFLDHFSLGSLKQLPKLAEFTDKDIEIPRTLQVEDETASKPAGGPGGLAHVP